MSIVASIAWSCGSKVRTKYVIHRLPNGTNLTDTQHNRYNVCVSDVAHKRHLRLFRHLHADGNRPSATFPPNHKDA